MIDWLRDNLPQSVLDALPWLGIVSIVMFVATPFVAWWIVARMPVDYFTRAPKQPRSRSFGRVALAVIEVTLGVALILAGIAMLILPGQGLLTILIGLMMVGFPGRRAIERRMVANGGVQRALNALRRRAGRQPLQFPT